LSRRFKAIQAKLEIKVDVTLLLLVGLLTVVG
jgi:hypothetical protein